MDSKKNAPRSPRRKAARRSNRPERGSARPHSGTPAPASRDPAESFTAAICRAEAEREKAPALYRRLADLPSREQLTTACNDPRFGSLGLAVYLLAAPAYRLSPEGSAERARLALAVASQLDPEAYPAGLLFDVTGRALARIAGARARRGELEHTDGALLLAAAVLEDGTADPLEAAHLLEQAAIVRRRQGRHLEARRFLHQARDLYLEVGETAAAAKLAPRRSRSRRPHRLTPA